MSINHIQTSIPDDEKFNVKFATVYCDEVVTGSGSSSDGYVPLTGIAVSSPTSGVSSLFPSNVTVIKNYSTFVLNFYSTVDFSTNVSQYDLLITLPTGMVEYYTAHPTAFQTNFITANGYSNTSNPSVSYQPNNHFFALDVLKQSSTQIKVTMRSISNDDSGPSTNSHSLRMMIAFSGPAN